MDEGGQTERHPVRVLIRDDDVEHVVAHSWMHNAPGGTQGHGWREVGDPQEGDEDPVYVMNVQPAGGEGHGDRGSFLAWIDPKDTEGEGVGDVVLIPAAPDDLEAQGFRAGVLKPDPSGSWSVELEDDRG